ncbi:MAG TPA: dihydropteroate synthase, partial [Gemmatimonadales bacterium]|nr:dihydropteroate synthase [Gemmatimonadales bacterium]
GSAVEALVRRAAQLGLEVLTGPDWAVLAGSLARLSALARPWGGPPELAEVAYQVGLALPAEPTSVWPTARGPVPLDKPALVGILNVTPDSFSDGGRFSALEPALAHAQRLLDDGAHILDVGGESTRPGARPVPAEEEIRRVVPVIEALVRRHPWLMISVDTVKAEVARAAVEAGAAIVNDVSAFRLDPGMPEVVASTGAGVILMHSRGTVSTMASLELADYGADVVRGVLAELRGALDAAVAAGIPAERIVLDPGLGFAKTPEQNILLLDRLASFRGLGRPILVGPSRKRFLGAITGREVGDRDRATAAACVVAYERGARLFRVHDVAAAREALSVAHAIGGHRIPS